MNLEEQYIEDVLFDKQVVCQLTRQSVERHVNDLEHLDGFTFDREAGERAIKLFGLFRHTKGQYAGKKFKLAGVRIVVHFRLERR